MLAPPVRTHCLLVCTLHLLLFPSLALTAQPFICSKVIDGNTLLLNNHQTVRLIGVNTPFPNHHDKRNGRNAQEASDFTRRMVEGKPISLAYDRQERDAVGRALAYVYLMDNTLLNAEIIKQGYGLVDTHHPFQHLSRFRQYEQEARKAKRGLWSDTALTTPPALIQERYTGSQQDRIYHKPYCTLTKEILPDDRKEFISVREAAEAGYQPCKICRPPYNR